MRPFARNTFSPSGRKLIGAHRREASASIRGRGRRQVRRDLPASRLWKSIDGSEKWPAGSPALLKFLTSLSFSVTRPDRPPDPRSSLATLFMNDKAFGYEEKMRLAAR